MENYANRSGISAVARYGIGEDYIIVEFKTGPKKSYKYTYASAGSANVERMKQLAVQGLGLNSFINRYVKKLYDPTW